jgi:hypothetical protein
MRNTQAKTAYGNHGHMAARDGASSNTCSKQEQMHGILSIASALTIAICRSPLR